MRAKLHIDKFVYGGTGLARYGETAVFVPFVVPGEEVEVEFSGKGGVAHGVPVGWEQRSSERTEPPCPVFGQCGGCHYQHVAYARQCAFKREILRETLRRIGGLSWDGDIPVETADPWGYRNRSQVRIARSDGVARTGFFASGSHRLVATEDCTVNSPALNRAHRVLGEMVRDRQFPKDLRQVEFFTNESELQVNLPRRPGRLPKRFWSWCGERLGVSQPGVPLSVQCGEDRFRVSGRSFFQVNRYLAGRLAELATEEAGGQLAWDLYCGVGLLTVPLARSFSGVTGVESGALATRDLQRNAARAGLSVQAVQMDVLEFLKGCRRPPDLVLADPPRQGLGNAVVEQIVRLAPPELRLVSCDPATLARDLKGLLAGGYQLERLILIDLFPQTFHIETLAVLQRS